MPGSDWQKYEKIKSISTLGDENVVISPKSIY